MVWPWKPKRWGNEYRVVCRSYGSGDVQYIVEKNLHEYGAWSGREILKTESDAILRADDLYAEFLACQFSERVVTK